MVSGSISAAASAVRPRASSASDALAARSVAASEASRPAWRAARRPRSATSEAFWKFPVFSRASLSLTAARRLAAPIPGGFGQCPGPLKDGEPLLDLPAKKRVGCQPRQEVGDQGRGAGRFGDLQARG